MICETDLSCEYTANHDMAEMTGIGREAYAFGPPLITADLPTYDNKGVL